MLARSFGCARVVFNDALRARQDAYAAGVRVSDTDVQRWVVTHAKMRPERA
ncbi:helix-turn-helix protein, partial [Rhodococcus sp. SMB37]|uniref:helix-turn-helix domain-containing protein n=1 Tax=Rhodococcus sp. SMB37 TaxID=2512213 RepID=UPI0010E24820